MAAAATVDPAQQVLGDNGKPLGTTNGGAGSTVHMHFASNGKCIAVGAPLYALRWTCDGGHAEEFTQQLINRTWSFAWLNRSTGVRSCLEASGQYVNFATCSGASAQRWSIGAHGELLSFGSPGKCVSDPSTTTTNGVRLVMRDCVAYPSSSPTPAPGAPPAVAGPVTTQPARTAAPATGPRDTPPPQQDPAMPALPAVPSASATDTPTLAAAPRPDQSPSHVDKAPFALPKASTTPPAATTASPAPSAVTRMLIPVVAALALLLLLARTLPGRLPARTRNAPRQAAALTSRYRDLVRNLTRIGRRLRPTLPRRLRPRTRTTAATTHTVTAAPPPHTDPAETSAGTAGTRQARAAQHGETAPAAAEPNSTVATDPGTPAIVLTTTPGIPAPRPLDSGAAALAGTTPGAGAPVPDTHDFAGGVRVAPTPDGEAWLPPSWWQPHPVLFSAFATWDAKRSVFTAGQGEVDALQIAERISGSEQWNGSPLLLVTQSAPAGWAVQLLTDYLQVPVVAGAFEAKWWVTSPRCAERGWMPPAPLPGEFPFEPDGIAAFRTTMPAAPTPAATVPTQNLHADERSAALLESGRQTPLEEELHRWLRDQWKPGLYAVAVHRTPDSPITPYAFGESAWTGWDLAAELWAIRDRWQPHARVLCLLTDGPDAADERQLRLLSRYLGIEVVDARGPVPDAGPTPPEQGQGQGQGQDAGLPGRARAEDPNPAAAETTCPAPLPPAGTASPIGVPVSILDMATTVAAEPPAARSLASPPVGAAGESRDPRRHPPHRAAPARNLDNTAEPPAAGAAVAPAAAATTAEPDTARTVEASAQERQPGVLQAPESVDAARPSTAQERSAFRELMHRRYDIHARAVTQTLATSPGLRSGSGGPAAAEESDVCDLAAVRALVNGDWPQEPKPAQLAAWAACLTSGLRMLPTFRGTAYVWRGWEHVDPALLTVGRIVTCDNVLRARLAPSGDAHQLPVDVVVWSQSGRRTRPLLPEDAQEEVLFPGRTAFRVLAVQAGGSEPVARVLLRQLSLQEFARARALPATGQEALGDKDVKTRARLLAAVGESLDEAVPHIATV